MEKLNSRKKRDKMISLGYDLNSFFVSQFILGVTCVDIEKRFIKSSKMFSKLINAFYRGYFDADRMKKRKYHNVKNNISNGCFFDLFSNFVEDDELVSKKFYYNLLISKASKEKKINIMKKFCEDEMDLLLLLAEIFSEERIMLGNNLTTKINLRN